MNLLKIILIVVGVVFTTFGYLIYFKEKYNLINGFEADYKSGRKTEYYAKKGRIGRTYHWHYLYFNWDLHDNH